MLLCKVTGQSWAASERKSSSYAASRSKKKYWQKTSMEALGAIIESFQSNYF